MTLIQTVSQIATCLFTVNENGSLIQLNFSFGLDLTLSILVPTIGLSKGSRISSKKVIDLTLISCFAKYSLTRPCVHTYCHSSVFLVPPCSVVPSLYPAIWLSYWVDNGNYTHNAAPQLYSVNTFIRGWECRLRGTILLNY